MDCGTVGLDMDATVGLFLASQVQHGRSPGSASLQCADVGSGDLIWRPNRKMLHVVSTSRMHGHTKITDQNTPQVQKLF